MDKIRRKLSTPNRNKSNTPAKAIKRIENPDRDKYCSWLNTNYTNDTLNRRIKIELENIAYWAERAGKAIAEHDKTGCFTKWKQYQECLKNAQARLINLIDLYYKKSK